MTIDVACFELNTQGPATQTIARSSEEGGLLSGPTKLAQRFLIELFTEKSSLAYEPTRGCGFAAVVRHGLLETEVDVAANFSLAMLEVGANLRQEEKATDPDDERFGSAVLNSVTLVRGGANMSIALKTRAGVITNVTIPLDFPI